MASGRVGFNLQKPQCGDGKLYTVFEVKMPYVS